ncbi:pseudouridylate synthase RPUSD4, mitochondrial [Myripristis murdjan]|uniref:Pseudouridylate synthase RPUSD4, mitochondrial n=1 Tax=Myripristis murdjan TaxID=586833 RepID=A0A667YRJ0_9TELE|nr:mitochondrial RNA pseudouridine synthase rpusd4-like [Myripristis murdjan]
MSRFRRVQDVCRSDWSLVLNTSHSRRLRSSGAASRSHAAAAEHAAGTQPGHKPRLRAIDLAQKIQQEKVKEKGAASPSLSAQDRRVTELRRLTRQLQKVHPNVLARHLDRGVLFQDRDVVVVNKPYGVPLHGGSGDGSGVTSISSVLPVLAKMMNGMKSGSQLFPCLRLEKETTGTLLLARSEEVAEHILNLHRNNQVQSKYWVVTVGVPVPSEGVIDIPLIEREVTGPQPHFKMALSPLYRLKESGDGMTRVRAHRQAHGAVTKYRVLDSSSGCSLVELQPLTRVKHQMRVHMALGLACPILGDHKYSHWSKLAPQNLPERVLGKLGLEQTKVRYLPLHLHARQLTLPENSRQPDISVSCPLPKYFTSTLRRLHLALPDEQEPE